MLDAGGHIPLPGLVGPVAEWFEVRHLDLMAQRGFDDVRRAHNQVFIHLPANGLRLTDLARAAGISKQAMSGLVDDLIAMSYLDRVPDPTDGRAKLITWAPRGLAAHEATMRAFAEIEAELAGSMGEDELAALRSLLFDAVRSIGAVDPGAGVQAP